MLHQDVDGDYFENSSYEDGIILYNNLMLATLINGNVVIIALTLIEASVNTTIT